MAVANRQYGKNLSVFSVAGDDLAALIASATIDRMSETIDATVLVDATVYNLAYRDNYTISFSVAYDDANADLPGLIDAVGTEVAFSVTVSSGGENYAGTGLLRRAAHNIPDGGQTIDFEIVAAGTALEVT